MDEQFLEQLARLAGLEKALTECRADVLAAARDTLSKRTRMPTPAAPTVEPWPPMRPGIGL